MKASTAATVLRSTRSRAETTGGIVQMGEYEQFAIAVALATVESDLFHITIPAGGVTSFINLWPEDPNPGAPLTAAEEMFYLPADNSVVIGDQNRVWRK